MEYEEVRIDPPDPSPLALEGKDNKRKEDAMPDNANVTNHEGVGMTTRQRRDAESQESAPAAPSQSRRMPGWVAVLALVLAVAVGIGIGFLTSGRDSAVAADPEVEQFVDDFVAAWNAYDADAIRAIATANAFVSSRYVTDTGTRSLEAKMEDYRADGVTFEPVGAPIVRDGGDVLDVTQLLLGGPEGGKDDFIVVMRLIRDDDTLKLEWDRPYNYESWRSLFGD